MPTALVGDRRLHYRDEGANEVALVLVHDFPLHCGMWNEQLRAFAGEPRVVAPDLAGCGESSGFGDPGRYSIEAWADDVISLIAMLDLESVVLVGSGVGADVALAAVRQAHELVGAVGLAAPRAQATAPAEHHVWGEQARWIAREGDLGPVVDRWIDGLTPRNAPGRAEVVEQARWMIAATSRAGWIGGLEALRRRPDPSADADKIDTPAIVIVGERDAITPPSEARSLAGRIPGAGVVEMLGVGHVPNLEQPGAFNRILADLAAGRVARRRSGRHSWPAAPAGSRSR